jgi:hypothetical protein
MSKWLTFCIALVCLICVVVICIAPDLDLPDTVLRAKQLTVLLLLAALVIAPLCTRQTLALKCRSNLASAPPQTSRFECSLRNSKRSPVFLC